MYPSNKTQENRSIKQKYNVDKKYIFICINLYLKKLKFKCIPSIHTNLYKCSREAQLQCYVAHTNFALEQDKPKQVLPMGR